MYAFEAFLSLVVASGRTSTGSCAAAHRWARPARSIACADGVRPQLGAVLLRRGSRRDGALRTRAAEGVRDRRRGRRSALPAVAADAALAGEAHRRALVDASRASTSCSPRRARCSAATRRSSRSSLLRRRGWLVHPRPHRAGAREFSSARPSCSPGCRRRSRRRGRRATSPSSSARSYCSPPRQSCAAGRVGLVALVAVLFLWWGFSVRNDKENAKQIAGQLAPFAAPGRARHLDASGAGAGASLLPRPGAPLGDDAGAGPDSQVFDWRDAVTRLKAAEPRATLDPLLATVPHGRRVRRRSRPSFATTERGARRGRTSSGGGPWPGRRCSSTTRECSSSGTSRATRSPPSGTTSSRCRRSSIAESDRLSVPAAAARPADLMTDEITSRRHSSSAAAQQA